MKVIIFGATGMIGQGVLRESLADSEVKSVLSVGRSGCGITHPKLRELLLPDLLDYSRASGSLTGYDACFFCLGTSANGMTEEDYHRLTFQLTSAAARALAALNPVMTFCYVSGAGTDSTERGRIMWARVKGKTENHLLGLPFKAAYMFRPGYIQPLDGITSRTASYRIFYGAVSPLYPLLKVLFPGHITTTRSIGRAMINVVKRGYANRVLEARDIIAMAENPSN